MLIKWQILVLFFVEINGQISTKLILEEFFNYTDYLSIVLEPNHGQSALIEMKKRIWERNINEQHLYLYSLETKNRILITTKSTDAKPQWKDDLILLKLNDKPPLQIYSTVTNRFYPLEIAENDEIHSFTWSTTNQSIFLATQRKQESDEYHQKWKDVIQYREQFLGDRIYRIDLENLEISKQIHLIDIDQRVDQLTCSPDGSQLVFSVEPPSQNQERLTDYELYSLDLIKLTNNTAVEKNLKWSFDGLLFFTVSAKGSIAGDYEDFQGRIYSLNLTNQQIQRWAQTFQGHITDYQLVDEGRQGIVFTGQLGTQIHIYSQLTCQSELIKRTNSIGSFEMISTTKLNSRFAFIYSELNLPQEVYWTDRFDQMNKITNENQLFTQRNLPKGKSFQWINQDDQIEIEGILLYPPDRFEQKNLPLLTLIHGGPYDADTNVFHADWYYSAVMFATQGWLVFQPNYRGSTGYGDRFLKDIRFEIVSRPGKDILYGIDALVRDEIAHPKQLTIGGYSYGAYLTGWLITQTTRFNAALFGAGAIEHVADWGLTDIPYASTYLFGGYPWQVQQRYQKQSAIFHLDRIRTPTHIVVPAQDIRVSYTENYLLERGLVALGIPTKMIILPDEAHLIENNPWHEFIKIREEIRWLEIYANISLV